jgi:hypothetical protein
MIFFPENLLSGEKKKEKKESCEIKFSWSVTGQAWIPKGMRCVNIPACRFANVDHGRALQISGVLNLRY